MNAIKNLIVFGALAAVCYGVYTSVMTAPTSEAPEAVAPELAAEPSIELAEAQPSPLDALPGGFGVDDVFADFPDSNTNAPPAQAPAEPDDSVFQPLAEPRDLDLDEFFGETAAPAAAPPSESDEPAPTTPPAAAPAGEGAIAFTDILEDVRLERDAGELTDVLRKLTLWYGDDRLSDEDHAKLTAALDDLAFRVIYSREHHLEQPYFTTGVETLSDVAARHQVPWPLLAKVNGYMDPTTHESVDPGMLPAGTELKVVRGPFHAIVDVASGELLLLLNQELYAGRFPVSVAPGRSIPNRAFAVQAKQVAPTYTSPAGQTISGDDPTNPLGGFWIGLTDEIGLHGSPSQDVGTGGALRLADRDIREVYDILAVGSQVQVLR